MNPYRWINTRENADAKLNGRVAWKMLAYWIPAFWVPSLLVTHYLVFRILIQSGRGAAPLKEEERKVTGAADGRIVLR